MLLAIDLDGPLANVSVPLMRFHNRVYGTKYTVNDILNYELSHLWNTTLEEATRRFDQFHDSPYAETIKPTEGSVEGVGRLRKKKYDLAIVTSRHHDRQEQTVAWIEKYFPNRFSEVHFSGDFHKNGNKTKDEICQEIGASALIDDNVEYVRSCVERDIGGVLFNRPHNANEVLPEGAVRANDWDMIVRIFDLYPSFARA